MTALQQVPRRAHTDDARAQDDYFHDPFQLLKKEKLDASMKKSLSQVKRD
jgi:hypothetical protein